MEFADYRGTIAAMRTSIVNEIKEIIRSHNTDTVNYAANSCNCPILMDSDTDDGIYTLDEINLNGDRLTFDGSNSYTNRFFESDDVDIEKLLSILEDMKEEGDNLFDEED